MVELVIAQIMSEKLFKRLTVSDVCSSTDWPKKDSAFLSNFIAWQIFSPHDLNDSKWSQMTPNDLTSIITHAKTHLESFQNI